MKSGVTGDGAVRWNRPHAATRGSHIDVLGSNIAIRPRSDYGSRGSAAGELPSASGTDSIEREMVRKDGEITTGDRDRKSPPRRTFVVWLASCGGLGFSPMMPGTVGAIPGLAVAWVIGQIESTALEILAVASLSAVSIPICTAAARRMGNEKDPGWIVLDEIASMPITFLGLAMDSWRIVLVGFALNRLFDITKPPPARQLERLSDGWGVMADDWAAGVYSHLALRLVIFWWSGTAWGS